VSDREQILARVRAALGSQPELPEVPRAYNGAGASELDEAQAIELFCERVTDYGAGLRQTDAAATTATVAAAAAAHGATALVAPAGLAPELPGLDLVLDDPPLPTAELDRLDGVVTGSALAIAQTGTIVLDGGSRCGRRAVSLVPDLHICIVEIHRIVATVPDAIAALSGAGLETAPLTFVSGPSATADIEFSRVEGVHGPRRLEVVLVTGPASS
jgi:L-lactate dehydrogenase complex protein LldG